ncbi:MAG TPA: replication-associated recombination protein A [Acholeplasmataceae bacterium]|nr:replication-associated recombination protein A [Acholeplasmataceae bacterium]
MKPLAYRLRPKHLDDILGQKHLIGPKGFIRRMLDNNKIQSLILYGKPGIGKTTLAEVICNTLNIPHGNFNASTDNKAMLKEHITLAQTHERFILIVDEIHRMKKDIQDYLLGYVETGEIFLIGLTTINPYHSVNPAIRSRCLIFRLNDLSDEDLEMAINKTLNVLNLKITEEAKNYIIRMANGEVRFVINTLEGISFIIESDTITIDDVITVIQKPAIGIDKNEDFYYDALSGLQKSIRGSDVNASLHYLGLLLASEDLLPLIRRLSVIAYEDIGLANPAIGPKVKAACDIALELGMPEARIPLSVIVCDMALSPKSNSALLAIDAAIKDIEEGKSGPLPLHLKNTYSFDPNQTKYLYPHDYPGGWVNQQYLPDILKDASYYEPKTTSKYESALKERYDAINKAKKR